MASGNALKKTQFLKLYEEELLCTHNKLIRIFYRCRLLSMNYNTMRIIRYEKLI